MKTLLKVENLQKTFDTPVLKNINLEIKKGSSIAIMGASGEGKTTLLHLIGMLEKPTDGKINFSIEKQKSFRNSFFGFIFQTYNLLEDLTLLENILMPAYISRQKITKNSPFYKRALLLLEEVGLEKRANYLALFFV